MTPNNKFEEVLGEALKLFEEGKSIPEILDLFPRHKEDLQATFEAIELLRQGKDFIEPPKEFLSKILERISVKGLTYLKVRRYLHRGGSKGRLSVISVTINQIQRSMNLSWKIAMPIVVIMAVFAGLLVYVQSVKEMPQFSIEGMFQGQQFIGALPKAKEVKVVDVPEATGNVDDVVDAALAISLNEEYLFDAEIQDADLMDIDNQIINEFGQSYGEDEF